MSSSASKNDFHREYIYVRRLISMLTNDDSDKMIVEKLKGKNLSSLLYDAKIIDNSKNMTANKKILACVIRAIEREKHLCHKRELEQSWGRKFLNSFNCLYPVLKTDLEQTACVREQKSGHKSLKHQKLSKRKKASTTRTSKTARKSSFKNKCESSIKCANRAAEIEINNLIRTSTNSCVNNFRNRTYSCNDSVLTDKPEDRDDDLASECWRICQQVPVSYIYKFEKMMYENICPPLLQQRKLNCVMVYPARPSSHGRPLTVRRTVENAEKKSSFTQTSDSSYEPDPQLPKVPNNIKLEYLLEAASSLMNTDQKEYVKSFLTNFEPPFDLSAGFPPYLKLPMEKNEDPVGKESVYGTNSELSMRSDDRRKEEIQKYERYLAYDPLQDAADSIISGVIDEPLPLDKNSFSQLGACILKRLGAYPWNNTHNDTKHCKQKAVNIPEMILQCTELYESDAGVSNKNLETTRNEPEQIKQHKLDESPSIVEVKLIDETGHIKPWKGHKTPNYCFLDNETSEMKVDFLNPSERSLVDVETSQDKNELAAQGDASQDRKNLQLREPLKITPSGLEQSGKKTRRTSVFGRKCDNKKNKDIEPMGISEKPMMEETMIENKDGDKMGKTARPKVSIYTVSSDKNQELSQEVGNHVDGSGTIESISIMEPGSPITMAMPESKKDDQNAKADDHNCANAKTEGQGAVRSFQFAMPAEITETETPPPELANHHWEPADAEVETFDGVGEGQKNSTELPTSKPDKKQLPDKNRKVQEKIRKKKGKSVSKKKPQSDKNDAGNCRVM